tara:strand:- start:1324 stop:1980 length:657 start_codon:yes stop_codon:yes gene_type:complete
MTKYMKVTELEKREVYIDLYKINSIRASFTELRWIYVPNELDTSYGGRRHLANHTNDQGYFRTLFSVPGDSAMTVGGSAQEFIDHIEEQQKRARKGKEIEPYNPKWWTVYTENGKVHPINELLEPVGFRSGRSESRAINIQVAKYINQIEEIGQAEGMSYSPCPEAFSGKVLDLLSEAQDKLSVGNLRLLHKTVNSIVMKAMKHSQSANDTASISTGM